MYCVLPCTYFPFRAVTRCSSPDSQECAVLQYSMHRAWSNAPRLFLFYICRYSNYYCPRLMNSFHQIDSLANFARCSSSETLSSYRSTVFFSFLHSLGPPVKVATHIISRSPSFSRSWLRVYMVAVNTSLTKQ